MQTILHTCVKELILCTLQANYFTYFLLTIVKHNLSYKCLINSIGKIMWPIINWQKQFLYAFKTTNYVCETHVIFNIKNIHFVYFVSHHNYDLQTKTPDEVTDACLLVIKPTINYQNSYTARIERQHQYRNQSFYSLFSSKLQFSYQY